MFHIYVNIYEYLLKGFEQIQILPSTQVELTFGLNTSNVDVSFIIMVLTCYISNLPIDRSNDDAMRISWKKKILNVYLKSYIIPTFLILSEILSV